MSCPNRTASSNTQQYTSPPSALGFWFALEPCTASNGALSFLPGTHFTTDITKRFVRMPEGGTGFVPIDKPEKPLGMGDAKLSNADPTYVMETCDAGRFLFIQLYSLCVMNVIVTDYSVGALVLIHGSVLHKSEKNESELTRYAYTFHMIEGAPLAKYDEKNWLQPTAEMPFTPLFGNA